MNHFPRLETESFIAFIADNTPMGIHRAGYNGVASLMPKHRGNNLFVPLYAGLNYETISLAGLQDYAANHNSKFEPRCEPMYFEDISPSQVVLVQPETSHAHVSARITFPAREPCYLHQRIELVFHRRFCAESEKNTFMSQWASYMHMPPDRHIYMQLDGSGATLQGWVGITKEDHGAPEFQVRCLPDDREIAAEDHLTMMETQPLLSEQASVGEDPSPMRVHQMLDGPLRFYYGTCHGGQLLLKMFKQPERFRLAYSPCGAGKQPAWNPAWDYFLFHDDVQLEHPYQWNICLAVKNYEGRADVIDEVKHYRAGTG